jgi:hypothetical protein
MVEDLQQHWPSEIEINDSWDTSQAFDRIVKCHSIPALTKYIQSCSLICVPDIDGWRMKNLFQCISLSYDPREKLRIGKNNVMQEQCVNQTSRVSCPAVVVGLIERGTVQRPPHGASLAWRRSRIFFCGYLVAISFPNRIDVWGRLCTHLEAQNPMRK